MENSISRRDNFLSRARTRKRERREDMKIRKFASRQKDQVPRERKKFEGKRLVEGANQAAPVKLSEENGRKKLMCVVVVRTSKNFAESLLSDGMSSCQGNSCATREETLSREVGSTLATHFHFIKILLLRHRLYLDMNARDCCGASVQNRKIICSSY